MNDLSVLNEWLKERMRHQSDNVDMMVSNTSELSDLAQRYGTDKFCYSGIVTVRESKDVLPTLFLTIVLYPLLPYGIYNAIRSNQITSLYSVIVDASTGKVIMDYDHKMHMGDSKGVLNSNIYYLLQQIKATR